MFTLLNEISSLSFHHTPPVFPTPFLLPHQSSTSSVTTIIIQQKTLTVNSIFFTQSHYEHPQVLSENLSDILVLSRIISTTFSCYCFIKLATVVEVFQKAPFSIATTPRCRGGCYFFPWIAPLNP